MSLTSIFQPIRKRTKRAYALLFENPAYLFGRGSRTTIFPNGAREIWIGNADGTVVYKVRASDGPAGFSLTVSSAVGTLSAQSHVLDRATYQTTIADDVREVSLVSYYPDAYSQAFKRWYACDAGADGRKVEPFPADLGLTPRNQTEVSNV